MKKIVRLLMCTLPLLVLAACGGGGGSGDPPTPGSAPSVAAITPADGSAGVIASTPIKVTFSRAMNPASITASSPGTTGTFTVSYITDAIRYDALGNPIPFQQKNVVAGTLTIDPSNLIVTFQPTVPLPHDTDPVTGEHTPRTFTVTVKGGVNGVKEAGGTPMTFDFNASFTIWAGTQQLGTVNNDVMNGVGTDTGGNVYMAGYTGGSLGNTPNPDGSGSTSDILLVKYDANGARVWTQQLASQDPNGVPGAYDDKVFGFAVGGAGPDLVAAGYTDGTLNQLAQLNTVQVNPDPSGATHNYFVVKYNTDGTLVWATQAGPGPGGSFVSSIARGVAIDSVGNIYVTGETYGDLRDPSNLVTGYTTNYAAVSGGKAAIFIAKYSSTGNLQKTVLIGSTAGDFAFGIAVDSNTAPFVYITGRTAGTLPLTSGAGSIFVTKLDANLNEMWNMQFGSTPNDHPNAISVDLFGYVYVVGGTYGNLFATNQGPDLLGNVTSDIFAAKINPQGATAGSFLWAQQFGTIYNDDAFGVYVDQGGNAFVTGQTFGPLEGNSWSGGADIFVTKFAQTGTTVSRQWTRQLGTQYNDVGKGITVSSDGLVFVGGYTYGNLDTNANQDGTFNSSDYFLAKYSALTGLKY